MVVSVAAALACAGGGNAVVLQTPPTSEAQAEAAPWLAAEELPEPDCDGHASTYLWMALEAPDVVAAQALDALATCGELADLDAVAAARLDDDDPAVCGAALRLVGGRLLGRPPEDPLIQGVVASLDHGDAAVRYEAVEGLDRTAWTTSDALELAMLERLADPSPPVVSEVLARAIDRAAGLQHADVWACTARYALLAHLDPGIRGRSARLLARLQPESATTRLLLRQALEDPHPHVRASAAIALADAGDVAAVHLLVARLEDSESSVWTMLPWTGTDGQQKEQVHRGSHFERVDDACLRAIEDLTAGLSTPYRMRDISLRYLDLDLLGSARDARRWFEAHHEELPALAGGGVAK